MSNEVSTTSTEETSAQTQPSARSEHAQRQTYTTPRSSVAETSDGWQLSVEMPGVSKDSVKLNTEENRLTIVGHKSGVEGAENVVYRESSSSDYRREFELNTSIDTEQISARMEQGVLTVNLPKADRVKPRSISVTD